MKAHSKTILHSSGYPLTVLETKLPAKISELTIAKIAFAEQIRLQKKNLATDDPKNWDMDWFNNYE